MTYQQQGGGGSGGRRGGGGGFGNFQGQQTIRFGPKMTPVVKYFMYACGGMYMAQNIFPALVPVFSLVPTRFFSGWIWQLVSFNFLHANLMHLMMNMLMIWMFGGELEEKLGRRRFILLLVVSGMGAGFCQALAMASVPALIMGASGVVFGLLMVYGLTWPDRTVLVMFIFPMKVKWMVILFGVIEFMAVVGNGQPGIANLAHLGGMLFAFIFMRYDTIYMRLRRSYYERKLNRYRKKFRVYKGGKDDKDNGPTVH